MTGHFVDLENTDLIAVHFFVHPPQSPSPFHPPDLPGFLLFLSRCALETSDPVQTHTLPRPLMPQKIGSNLTQAKSTACPKAQAITNTYRKHCCFRNIDSLVMSKMRSCGEALASSRNPRRQVLLKSPLAPLRRFYHDKRRAHRAVTLPDKRRPTHAGTRPALPATPDKPRPRSDSDKRRPR